MTMIWPAEEHTASRQDLYRLALSDGQEFLVWLTARHPGRQVKLRLEYGEIDPAKIVGIEVVLDDLPDPAASAVVLRAIKAIGWSPLSPWSNVYLEPHYPQALSAHQRIDVIRRIEKALAR